MQILADKNHWRDTFQDQLNVDFKDWMYDQVAQNLSNKKKSKVFKDGICTEQLQTIGTEKDPIKARVKFSLAQREKSRAIESKDRRVVHFLFNTGLPTTVSPFARKYSRYLDGSLAEVEAAEREAFAAYAENLAGESLAEGETNPIVYGEMPFFHCDLTGGLNRLAFSTADDPFYKTSESKYYPEAVVFNVKGEVLARVNPDNRSSADYHMTYLDDVRDNVLKIDDDRKIQISFNQIKESGTMILLTVRQFVPKDGRVIGKEGEFDRAWFRLCNEETNQTLDYCMLSKVELPEDYQELIPNEEEEDAPPFRNTLTYIAGALFLDTSSGAPRWVFESYKNVLQAKDFRDSDTDAAAQLGEIYARAISEHEEQQKVLADAANALKKRQEE